MKNNPFFKKLAVLVAIFVTLSTLVAPAFATETLYISNSYLNTYNWDNVPTTVNATWRGYTFVGNDQFLSAVTFYLRNNSVAESGTIRFVLFNNMTGSATSDPPYAGSAPVEYSNATYNVAGLTEPTLVTLYFDDDTNLTSSQSWGVAIEVASTLGSTVQAAYSVAGGHWDDLEGDRAWSSSGSYGSIIYIYTNDEAAGGGSPYTPPGTADTTSWDATIASFTAFIVPLLVLLLPAFLLCFITRRVDKWLIIIGVTIGAGLGYYFNLVPLWLVFLITIGLIGMAYQSVRGGGGN